MTDRQTRKVKIRVAIAERSRTNNSYGDEIWCYMAFCAQVEEIVVEGGCDSIVVRKITVRQPDHSRQQQWEGSRCYSSLLSELAGGSLPDDSCPLHLLSPTRQWQAWAA